MRKQIKIFFILCSLGCIACSLLLVKEAKDRIGFSHLIHLEMEMECLACHQGVENSQDDDGRHFPGHDVCSECHEEEIMGGEGEGETGCRYCHSLPDEAREIPRTETHLYFSHQSHLEMADGDCLACHASVPESTRIEDPKNPPMAPCLKCHQNDYDDLRCQKCHESMQDKPLEPFTEYYHKGEYLKIHGQRAKREPGLCSQCHREQFCAECYNQREILKPSAKNPDLVDRHFIHRGDYLSSHSLEAGQNPGLCQKCHSQNECESCHLSRGLSADRQDSRAYHPAGWAQEHGNRARIEITSCASCHEQGRNSNCVECHSARTPGFHVNPHPPSWPDRYSRGDQGSHEVCLVCHE